MEQISPFPFDKVAKQIKRYHNAEVSGRGGGGGRDVSHQGVGLRHDACRRVICASVVGPTAGPLKPYCFAFFNPKSDNDFCFPFFISQVCWVQEEPKNMGAWSFVRPCIKTSTRKLNNMERKPRYIGRPTSAAPATGLTKVSASEYCGLTSSSELFKACDFTRMYVGADRMFLCVFSGDSVQSWLCGDGGSLVVLSRGTRARRLFLLALCCLPLPP